MKIGSHFKTFHNLITNRRVMKRFKKILFYTDANDGSCAALERAAQLALRNRGKLTVLGVLERLPRDLAKHPLSGIPHNVHLLKGDPAEVIASLTAKKRIDLIVMGTVGRTGIPGFLIGNTAETVLRQVNCSVLAVKPEGFVTPVKIEPIEGSPS